MSIRVLFVDDEPRILGGIRRSMRPMRGRWEMHFAEGGGEALAMMEERPFHVVVTDMRMPGMDGAEFLRKVAEQHPQTVRIVLSGHSEETFLLKAVKTAHQYLSKPCDPESLKAAVNRSLCIRGLLEDEALRGVFAGMTALPSLPSLYTELMEEIRSPRGTLERIGEIISRDLGMTAKILQLVNSAFFGLPRGVSSPVDAACLLGSETIKSLALTIGIFKQFEGSRVHVKFLERLLGHSVAVGSIAKRLARLEGLEPRVADDAFLAGMLHDIGKLILFDRFPEQYADVLDPAAKSSETMMEIEAETCGATHAEAAAYLLGLWGFCDSILEAVAFHHTPRKSPVRGLGLLEMVHVGDALEHEMNPESDFRAAGVLDMEYLAEIGKADRLPKWREACVQPQQEGMLHG